MAHLKRSVKHRKSSRKHLKARRTRARRGGAKCFYCGKYEVAQPGMMCSMCSMRNNGSGMYTTGPGYKR
jgi:hypothetical protein